MVAIAIGFTKFAHILYVIIECADLQMTIICFIGQVSLLYFC